MLAYEAKYVTIILLPILLGISRPVLNHPATSSAQAVEKGKDDKNPFRAVTFNFMGKVAHVRDSGGLLDGSIQLGSRLTGTYTFDPKTPDSNEDPTVGDYKHSAAGYGLLIK